MPDIFDVVVGAIHRLMAEADGTPLERAMDALMTSVHEHGPDAYCGGCYVDGGPCGDLQAIAKALGIEHPDVAG